MGSAHFDVREGQYERMRQHQAQQTAAAQQRRALQDMKNFHYQQLGFLTSVPPKPRTNAIGIPLIRHMDRYNG